MSASISSTTDTTEMKVETPDSNIVPSTNTDTDTAAIHDTITDSSVQKQKDDSAENLKIPNSEVIKPEESKQQSDSGSALSDIEKPSAMTEEAVPAQPSDCTSAVPESADTAHTDDSKIGPVSGVSESAASDETAATVATTTVTEAAPLQNSVSNVDEKEKVDPVSIDIIAADSDKSAAKSVAAEVAAVTDSVHLEPQNISIAVEEKSPSDNVQPDNEKKENDIKDEGTGGEVQKDLNGAKGTAEAVEESATADDKEASSDDADQFVDAKSHTQIDGASGGDAESSGEAKEQAEAVQDEEEFFDEEEQEQEPDDDEIEGNPAYIPKSGRYYMHDSRNADEERAPEPSSRSRADGKWKHDRFDERSQRPKTRRELMNRYGYDIRNEGNNNNGGGNNTNGPAPYTNRARGVPRGGSTGGIRGGNRGRYPNRAPPPPQQLHQQDDRRDKRRTMQDGGTGRPAIRGARRGEHHPGMNNQRDQTGTRVFKNTPYNAQRGTNGSGANRMDNHRSYARGSGGEHMRDSRRTGGRGGIGGNSGGIGAPVHERGANPGGKRYSAQRFATNYVPDAQPPPPPPPPPQPAPTAGPIPIPPPDWRPPATATFQGPPAPPPPPPLGPVPNFHPGDCVYFDVQPQQLYRNPMPPRAKKRLEIVPPNQAKNSN